MGRINEASPWAMRAKGFDDTIMVKRVEKYPGKLVLRSDNKDYAPIMLGGKDMNGARIIGKVVWVCRNLL